MVRILLAIAHSQQLFLTLYDIFGNEWVKNKANLFSISDLFLVNKTAPNMPNDTRRLVLKKTVFLHGRVR